MNTGATTTAHLFQVDTWLRRAWVQALFVFVLALALRLLFWQATPDAAWPYSVWYKGDAPLWLDWASAIREARPHDAGLPIRPPGMAYFLAALWDGNTGTVVYLRFFWCLLGALTAVLIFAAARPALGQAAFSVGVVCAGATGLMMLSTSLNNETPYLLLVAAVLYLWEPVSKRPGVLNLAAWGAVHAAAALVRVEHVLFFALVSCWLAVGWWRGAPQGEKLLFAAGRLAMSLLVFGLALAPWHYHAWSAVRTFNEGPAPIDDSREQGIRRVERLLSGITWEPEALAELERLPAAVRRTARNFITATVGVRGGSTVTAGDFGILEQAFGTRPQRLTAYPFVVLYGGLNFYLANNEHSTGGFTRAPLEQPPPLAGGLNGYPLAMVRGLPPPQLALEYPPHLAALNEGYERGWRWIFDHPGNSLRLAVTKLHMFWRGATLGLGGYNLPAGLSGTRPPVDLTVPSDSLRTSIWRALLLALVIIGIHAGWRRPALFPWLAFLLSKILVVIAFFGYARQGASVVPCIAVLAVLGTQQIAAVIGRNRPPGRSGAFALRATMTTGVLLLVIETGRWTAPPEVFADGHAIGSVDPFPAKEYAARHIRLR